MKRYLVFAGWSTCRNDGWHTFKASFDAEKDAIDYAGTCEGDWFQVVDSQTIKIVLEQDW
jgi:hypothetical protein